MTANNVPPRRLLRRRTTDRYVAGVGGGLADYLGVDATVVRLVLVALTVFGGSGLALYAAGWLLIPLEGEDHSLFETRVLQRR